MFVCVLLLYIYLLMTVCSALYMYVHRLFFFSRRVSVCVYLWSQDNARSSRLSDAAAKRGKRVCRAKLFIRDVTISTLLAVKLCLSRKYKHDRCIRLRVLALAFGGLINLFVRCICILVILLILHNLVIDIRKYFKTACYAFCHKVEWKQNILYD